MFRRLKGEYADTGRSGFRIDYEIHVYDKDLVAHADIPFIAPEEICQVTFENGDEFDLLAPVATGSAKVNMIINSAELHQFYLDFISSPEGRFFCEVFWIPSSGTPVSFVKGKIIHDLFEIEDKRNAILSFEVQSPLMELDTIDFTWSTFFGQFGSQPFISVLLGDCIAKSPTINEFYSATDEFLHVMYDRYPKEFSDAVDVLSNVLLFYYHKRSKNKQQEKITVLDVLKELLRSLGSRLYYNRGVYVLEEVAERTTAVVRYDRYQLNTDYIGQTTNDNQDYDFDTTIVEAVEFPSSTLIAPIKLSRLTQNGDYIRNLLFDIRYGYNLAQGEETLGFVEIFDNERVYTRIRLTNYINKSADFVIGQPQVTNTTFEVKIRVGDQYLSGSGSIAAIGQLFDTELSISDATWSTDTASVVSIELPAFVKYNNVNQNASDIIFTIDITSPLIPASGQLSFDINANPVTVTGLPNPYTHIWECLTNALSVVANITDGEENVGDTIHTLTNNLANSIVYNTAYNMADLPGTNSPHRVKVLLGPSNSIDSNGWVDPDAGTIPFEQLALHDINRVRQSPRLKLIAGIKTRGANPILYRNRLKYKGNYYLPLRLTTNTKYGFCEGVWMQVVNEAFSPPAVDVELPSLSGDSENNLLGSAPSNVVNLQGSGGEAARYERIDSATGNEVTLQDITLPNLSNVTIESVRANMLVYVRGVKYYLNSSIQTVDNFIINNADNKLVFATNINGARVEIFIIGPFDGNTATS